MHITFMSYATPEQHERIKEYVNQMKIPFKGNKRQGYYIPSISEIKLYDVRLKKECVPQFLKNMEMQDFGIKPVKPTKEQKKMWNDAKKSNKEHHIPKYFRFALNLFRKLLGYKTIEFQSVKNTHAFLKGWKYNILLGVKDDPTYKGKEIL